uniref:Uncharacterized protein n=1 Tax=Arundo donax TaxID=35708 RepID=A0A0A9CEM5_ARUDO
MVWAHNPRVCWTSRSTFVHGHGHQVPGSMGSRNGIKEWGTLLAEGFNKAGTRLFPCSQDEECGIVPRSR